MITATCDKCNLVSDPMEMTSLAGGGWDARSIPAKLKRWDWSVEGEITICPDCMEEARHAT